MELHPEYIRDIHSHYMVLKGNKEENSSFSAKMLMNNSVEGLLQTELRYMNSLDLYYYNVTSKKTVKSIYESKSLDYTMTLKLIKEILQTIENSGEFLLEEHDFILNPEYMFLDEKDKIFLCYFPGFSKNIHEQLSDFFEYIMNKIDYKDEAAVRLIYALYKESRDKESTFYKLYEVMDQYTLKEGYKKETVKIMDSGYSELVNKLNMIDNTDTVMDNNAKYKKDNSQLKTVKNVKNNKAKEISSYKKEINIINSIRYKLMTHNTSSNRNPQKNNSKSENYYNKTIPYNYNIKIESDKNEVVNDKEILYFGTLSYVLAGSCIIAGIIALIVVYLMGLVRNTFGNDIDTVKFFACVLVVVCVEIYVVSKIFDPNRKITKMETVIEYIDEEEFMEGRKTGLKKEHKAESEEERTQILWNNLGGMPEEKTQILNYLENTKSYYLIPIKTKTAEVDKLTKVKISTFPFYIGKLSNTSNLVIEDKSISRRHGVITRMEERILYTDLDSTNGTFINGAKLEGNKTYQLTSYDEISFANIKYLLEELEGE